MADAPAPSLIEDLTLVLPPDALPGPSVTDTSAGEDDLAAAAEYLVNAACPLITGTEALTMEGVQVAVELAERLRARLALSGPTRPRHPRQCNCTLGEALNRPLAVTLAVDDDHPVLKRLADRGVERIKLSADLPAIRDLGQALRDRRDDHPLAGRLRKAGRASVVTGPDLDPRLLECVHDLCVHAAQAVRLHVLAPGRPATNLNQRGAREVITWQTGLDPAHHGIDFADGGPRPGPDAPTLIERNLADVILDGAGRISSADNTTIIRLGPERGKADLWLPSAGLAPGVAGRVSRFDGVVLWLTDDPTTAPPPDDLTHLTRLLENVKELT